MKMKLNVEQAGLKIYSKFQMQVKLFFLTIVIYTHLRSQEINTFIIKNKKML